MKSYPLIEALTNVAGLSGFERAVVETALPFIEEGLVIERGGLNNLYIKQTVNEGKPLIVLDGHSDELGFMVQSITPKGLLRIVPMGSWDPRNIPAHSVKVYSESLGWITGVFSSKPPHFMTEEEKRQNVSFEKLLIDVGASSREELKAVYNIRVGAPVVPNVQTEILPGGKLMGKAFDNRLGCALVIDLMNHFKHKALKVQLVGSLSSQEEVGTRGAKVASFELKPRAAIVFEGTPADDTFTETGEIQGGLGRGSQLRYRDASMISSPTFCRFATDLADVQDIAYQEAVRSGGGTDGGVYHIANAGIPSIVLGVPVRYAHTHFGISSYSDYQATFDWAVAIIEALSEEALATF